MAKPIADFLGFIQQVINGDVVEISRVLNEDPAFATMQAEIGASRQISQEYFFSEISHYLYAGDTALHMAAAAFRPQMVELLIAHGADCRAKNRRGAEPLHYAADGRTDSDDQAKVIEFLISSGADLNAVDKSGVTPLHRAVRRRSLGGVRALLDGGANVRQRNNSSSTPLHLAVQNTGASGSGSKEAHEQQAEIIKLLIERGARPTDKDSKGKSVEQVAKSDWIRNLLIET
jgi:ankyrin repeat protein